MTYRTFTLGIDSKGLIVYDPCTGSIHLAPSHDIMTGRHQLDGQMVSTWPIIFPHQLTRDVPVSICWSLVVQCNLRCPFCLDNNNLEPADEKMRFHLSNLIARAGILGVDISGGEPLLVPELKNLIMNITRGGIAVSITTNGWYLRRRISDFVGCVDAIRISFDGADASAHDRWRGRGSFQKALAGLRTAVNLNIPVQIQTLAMRSNVKQLQKLLYFAADEGAFGITILQMLPLGRAVALASHEMLTDAEIESIINDLRFPSNLRIRIRRRQDAANFTVIRADGSIYRNDRSALSIVKKQIFANVEDLRI